MLLERMGFRLFFDYFLNRGFPVGSREAIPSFCAAIVNERSPRVFNW